MHHSLTGPIDLAVVSIFDRYFKNLQQHPRTSDKDYQRTKTMSESAAAPTVVTNASNINQKKTASPDDTQTNWASNDARVVSPTEGKRPLDDDNATEDLGVGNGNNSNDSGSNKRRKTQHAVYVPKRRHSRQMANVLNDEKLDTTSVEQVWEKELKGDRNWTSHFGKGVVHYVSSIYALVSNGADLIRFYPSNHGDSKSLFLLLLLWPLNFAGVYPWEPQELF